MLLALPTEPQLLPGALPVVVRVVLKKLRVAFQLGPWFVGLCWAER